MDGKGKRVIRVTPPASKRVIVQTAPRKADMRSPLAKARDAWFDTVEGRYALDGNARGQYLRNRLECAFIAGWKAARDTPDAESTAVEVAR